MPLYGDILQANFFDLKNLKNHPLIYLYISLIMGETTKNHQKTLFKFLAVVSKIITAIAVATAFRVLYWWRQQCKQISNGRLEILKKNYPSNCNLSLFIYFFQFDFGCTLYNEKQRGSARCWFVVLWRWTLFFPFEHSVIPQHKQWSAPMPYMQLFISKMHGQK